MLFSFICLLYGKLINNKNGVTIMHKYYISYNNSNISKFNEDVVADHFKHIYKDISKSYPNINKWICKVLKEMYIENDREILYDYSKTNELMYMIILKKSEQKICHFYVYRKFRDRKLPLELIACCKRILKTETPLITISSLKVDQYKTILRKTGFVETDMIENMYIDGVNEYIYNGSKNLINLLN